MASGKVDVIDIYTTDAQIARLGLRVLEDDRGFFPRYDAVWLYRLDLESRSPAALAAMRKLERRIDEATMIAANVRVVLGGQTPAQSADSLLLSVLPADSSAAPFAIGSKPAGVGAGIVANTIQHLKLVGFSLLAAILIGVPLGVLAARARWLAAATLTGAGLLQTIPSLALLAFLVPLLGIGVGRRSSLCSSIACCRSCATRTSGSRPFRPRSPSRPRHSGSRRWPSSGAYGCRWPRPRSWPGSKRAR
jgi:osmoprotectant transport system permease protein